MPLSRTYLRKFAQQLLYDSYGFYPPITQIDILEYTVDPFDTIERLHFAVGSVGYNYDINVGLSSPYRY